jgi:hypothetical protein
MDMDSNFLALAERPVATRGVKRTSTVVFQTYTDEHVSVVNRTLERLGVEVKDARLQHHGLEIDFFDESDAALVRLAIPPLR